ncbi:MAG: hypothetical protein MZV64_60430 [Ignavibacteriales bacterium]|nr:hypothetical protein [Ignavibacteriales bacterium]
MRPHSHAISPRQADSLAHGDRVARMESAGDVRGRDVRHDVRVVADVLAHVTVEVDFHYFLRYSGGRVARGDSRGRIETTM